MTTNYLPAWATLAEASQWLETRTGEPWPLPRLIEAGAMPHIWLTPDADDPPNSAVMAQVFNGRHEGFIAPLIFAGDTHRLAIDRSGAMSMTRSPSGELVRFTPGIPFVIEEVRFKAEHVRRSMAGPTQSAEPVAPAEREEPKWKGLARDEARRIRKERESKGLFPSLDDLGEEVAREFRTRGIVGPNGHPLKGNTIKRQALQGHGITNDAAKLRRTLSKRGK